jgi:hypothetical protein
VMSAFRSDPDTRAKARLGREASLYHLAGVEPQN